jgi:hypothetical protein
MTTYSKLSDKAISFETDREFLEFYNKEENKQNIDMMKTRGLNYMFKIRGCRIGKLGEKIILRPFEDKNEFYLDFDLKVTCDGGDIESRLSDLERKMNLILKFMIKIILLILIVKISLCIYFFCGVLNEQSYYQTKD